MKTEKYSQLLNFSSQVKILIVAITEKVKSSLGYTVELESLKLGKMLRTQLAAKLVECNTTTVNYNTLVYICAATELAHTASLCHDDIIDNGIIRRGLPSLWENTSSSAAVLIGDLFFCEAMNMLQKIDEGRYLLHFISKVKEVCTAEIEQEILSRNKQLNLHTCIRLARGETGPFFAFIGYVYGGKNLELSAALEEAGYQISTAFQLADDLLDIVGDEQLSGKTLDSDSRHGKFTLPQSTEITRDMIYEMISELCLSALSFLNEWPQLQKGFKNFIENDLQSAFEHVDTRIKISC